MTATEYIILVDEQDQEIGQAEKIAVHEQNLLHRAFSIFIFRQAEEPQVLLQQRALNKYHSPGLWTNTCCSHPRPGEAICTAGVRRLREELGITAELNDLGWFHYNVHFPNGLSENEIDHVLIGWVSHDLEIHPNPQEVHAFRWITLADLKREIAENRDQFTYWIGSAIEKVSQALQSSSTLNTREKS